MCDNVSEMFFASKADAKKWMERHSDLAASASKNEPNAVNVLVMSQRQAHQQDQRISELEERIGHLEIDGVEEKKKSAAEKTTLNDRVSTLENRANVQHTRIQRLQLESLVMAVSHLVVGAFVLHMIIWSFWNN